MSRSARTHAAQADALALCKPFRFIPRCTGLPHRTAPKTTHTPTGEGGTTGSGGVWLAAGPVAPNWRPYLDKLPSDAWKHPYQYANPGLKGEVDVYSFGADGVAAGEGKNADIGPWA